MKRFSLFSKIIFMTLALTGLVNSGSPLLAEGRSLDGPADPPNAQIGYLKSQLNLSVPGPHQPAAFVRSYEGSSRAYTYDQALSAIAFAHAGERESARRVLNALWNSQLPTGSFAFSYPVDDPGQISGAIAWVVIATNAYQSLYATREFDPMGRAALEHLASQRVSVEFEGRASRPVRFATSDDRRTTWNETRVVSVEHNLDAYSAFSRYRGSAAPRYRAIAASIRVFVESLWRGDRFYSGFDLEQERPNQDEVYLDTQSWGVLALGARGTRGESFASGLEPMCEEFLASVAQQGQKGPRTLFGFFDYRPANGLPPETFIWSEGTLGMMLALSEVGRGGCDGHPLRDFWSTINALTEPSGGVSYATQNGRGFSTRASVAGTAWAYFARVRLNPFRVGE